MVLGKTQTPLPSFSPVYFSSSRHRKQTVQIIQVNSVCNNTAYTAVLFGCCTSSAKCLVCVGGLEEGTAEGKRYLTAIGFLFISCLKPPAIIDFLEDGMFK